MIGRYNDETSRRHCESDSTPPGLPADALHTVDFYLYGIFPNSLDIKVIGNPTSTEVARNFPRGLAVLS